MEMTAAEFLARTGREPEQDDLERVNCGKVGRIAHRMCGWCAEHDSPRLMCGCLAEAIQTEGG